MKIRTSSHFNTSYIDTDCHKWIIKRRSNIPYKCPVCNGTGLVPNNFYISVSKLPSIDTSTSTQSITCRTCNGSGIV